MSIQEKGFVLGGKRTVASKDDTIADLKRKLKELEGDLTTAYMAGYHKRDDEVRNLRAHADALAEALEKYPYDDAYYQEHVKPALTAYRKYKEPGE